MLRWAKLAVIGAAALLLAVSAAHGQDAQGAEATEEPTPPQTCAECHLDVLGMWDDSKHALAFHNDAFQAAWSPAMTAGDCLLCHTTSYTPYDGTFAHAGVACEACHGETPVNHPPEALASTPDETICATCHLTTFREWRGSAHSANELPCATCHEPHTQRLTSENADALCKSCHDTAETPLTQSYAHLSHTETACADCHWHRSEIDPLHLRTGVLSPTGHQSGVTVRTCTSCHESEDSGFVLASVSELAQIEAAPAASAMPLPDLIMGGLLGLGVGAITAALLFTRRRAGS
ncbi:MAG: hypothetical protein JNL42_06680 [Anaerolineae bacterium]|nr:hypothetical protein [Anaerolineae bacterium]